MPISPEHADKLLDMAESLLHDAIYWRGIAIGVIQAEANPHLLHVHSQEYFNSLKE